MAAALIGSRFELVGVTPVIVPCSVGLALGVSVAIGLFFGGLPAPAPPGCAPSTPCATSEKGLRMSNQTPDGSPRSGPTQEVEEALKPKKTLKLPTATAVLGGVVVLAIGLAGGAGLHAAFASDSTPQRPRPAEEAGGYGGFRGEGGGQGGQGFGAGAGEATAGTVVSGDGLPARREDPER